MDAPSQKCPFPRSDSVCHIHSKLLARGQQAVSVPILYSGSYSVYAPFQKCPFPRGDSVSHLVRGFGGPRESTYQMASRSVQTFLQRSLVSVQHRTERETTHGGTSVTMGTATGLASVQSNFTVSHTLCGFPNFATGQNMATVTA